MSPPLITVIVNTSTQKKTPKTKTITEEKPDDSIGDYLLGREKKVEREEFTAEYLELLRHRRSMSQKQQELINVMMEAREVGASPVVVEKINAAFERRTGEGTACGGCAD